MCKLFVYFADSFLLICRNLSQGYQKYPDKKRAYLALGAWKSILPPSDKGNRDVYLSP